MNRHAQTRQLLYSFLHKQLTPEEERQVENHLAACKSCSAEVTMMRSAIEALPRPAKSASGERTEDFWNQFSMNVVRRIREEQAPDKSFASSVWETIASMVETRWRALAPAGAAVAIAGLILLLQQPEQPPEVADQQLPLTGQSVQLEGTAERAAQYFQRSKTLLVGISNMKTGEGQPVDLTAEKKMSRELVHEARYLKQQPLDVRSTRLIGDLERILIELANMEEEADLPNVEMIRGGIHRENLLFKIRMAQPLYDSTRIAIKQTSY